MKSEELRKILDQHLKWFKCEEGGETQTLEMQTLEALKMLIKCRIFLSLTLLSCPEGTIIGWKKCRNNVIVKLEIPAEAKRSNSTGRKCRAEYAKVLEIIGADVGISQHDCDTEYREGEIIKPDKWDDNRWDECSNGIHFFITRLEAENY